jgi:hypothetical protein
MIIVIFLSLMYQGRTSPANCIIALVRRQLEGSYGPELSTLCSCHDAQHPLKHTVQSGQSPASGKLSCLLRTNISPPSTESKYTKRNWRRSFTNAHTYSVSNRNESSDERAGLSFVMLVLYYVTTDAQSASLFWNKAPIR